MCNATHHFQPATCKYPCTCKFSSKMNSRVAILFSLLIISLIASTISASNEGNETDYQALMQFKSLVRNEGLRSWNSSFHHCDWSGVSCGKQHRRVTALRLKSQGLEGSLSPHVGNLSFLRYFSLADNNFQGSIPQELGRLSRLRLVNLTFNKFNGVIPSNLSRCSNLEELDLSHNNLVGSIPKEISFLSKLGFFNLSTNILTGGIPLFLGNLTSMKVFSAMENPFGGSIPDTLGNLKSLTQLYLAGCLLSGTIPTNLFGCSNLEKLRLSHNNLVGSIPTEIGLLSKLTWFMVAENKLTGGIPPVVGNITSMINFNVARNPLGGSIPDTLGRWKSVRTLVLAENQLTGSLPSALGTMFPHLEFLQLYKNQLTGPLPPSLSNCSKLKHLEVDNNNFSGKLTVDFAKLKDIDWITLSGNIFGSGEADDMKFIDTLQNCSRLYRLDFSNCNFQGVLPTSIGNLSNRLSFLYLDQNLLYGNLPSSIGNLVGLTLLSLWENRFTGKIPSTIDKLQNLEITYLDDNQFSGPIPDAIGNLSLLTKLYLSSNRLEGNIPSHLGNNRNLLELDIYDNKLSGKIPIQLLQLSSLAIALDLSQNSLSGSLPTDVGDLKMLVYLDLSDNILSGNIPSSIGGCTSLTFLSLKDNLFQGKVPPSLNSIRVLSILDLSHNNFSGPIPPFLQQLPLLEYVNLSFNNFEGEVPMIGVFTNASAFSVLGNSRLCGGLAELGLPKCHDKKRFPSFVILILIVSTVFTIICIVYACYKKRKGQPSQSSTEEQFMKVSYGQLLKATHGFSEANLIGEGGFSSVYKGVLDDGLVVAVKVIHLQNRGAHKSFLVECEAWRGIRHRNLLKIITSCSSIDFQGNDFKALVYEFMPNGTLHDWLHSAATTSKLNLLQRINILIDVAFALDYLHNHCLPTIVHCDLKPSNILLDDDMVAHVGDFGLARFLGTNSNQNNTSAIRGTIGYAPPEYGVGSEMTSSGDVYSFGILLLEVMIGKRPTDNIFREGLNIHNFAYMALPDHVTDIMDDDLLSFLQEDVIATRLELANAMKIEECLASTVKIGVSCSVDSPPQRMNIENVVHELQHVLETLQNIHWEPPMEKGKIADELVADPIPKSHLSFPVNQDAHIYTRQIEDDKEFVDGFHSSSACHVRMYVSIQLTSINLIASMQLSLNSSKFSPKMKSHIDIAFLFSFLIISLITIATCASNQGNETDYEALSQFKSMISNEGLRSWNSSFHHCDWSGVSCGKRHRRVTYLVLESHGLEGSLSPHVGNLSFLRFFSLTDNNLQGTIPHELGRLSRLRLLSLASNNFIGVIPSNLSGCSNLEELHLGHNKLVGSIPKEISFLSKLGFFYLRTNKLTGGIPPLLGNITSMKVFSASENSFGGTIPETLGRWKDLTEFQCYSCNLSGTIPHELGGLSRLRFLYLRFNELNGAIPSNLSRCSNLEELLLDNNRLVGSIPKEISFLSKLTYLNIHDNKLTGGIPPALGNITSMNMFFVINNPLGGSIPDTLGNWKSLTELYLGSCNLSGTIPHSIFNLSLLTDLSLSGNQLTGSLPSALGTMLPRLKWLQLRDNQLIGPLPPSISNCSKLELLEIQYNNFSGKLTVDFAKLKNIQWISLSYNIFGFGEADDMKFIDTLKNCSKLVNLDLSNCTFQGVLPTSIGNLSDRLSYLYLKQNLLYGNLPSSIGNLVGLTILDLSKNRFTGKIPSSIGNLQKLQLANLYLNQFSGPIPDAFGNLSWLTKLWLSSNKLECHIPSSLRNCRNLLELDFHDNKLSGKIPTQLLQLSSLTVALDLSQNNLFGSLPTDVGDLKMLASLDLSENKLSGNIPGSIKGCNSLTFLSLKDNLFQGKVPPSLNFIRALSTLDLSHNNFYGPIPPFLQQLPLLEYVNLSFNSFEGEVPMIGVFTNASAFSVLGNSMLCGGLAELGLPKCKETRKHEKRFPLFVILILIASTIFSIICIVYACYKKRKGQPSRSSTDGQFMKVSYGQLLKATNGFSEANLIGEGGFSSVYKGVLDDRLVVAVKVIHLQNRGAHKSFLVECEAWRGIRHRNLLKVITSCSSVDFQGNDFKALVYEFMPNGTLHDWLHSAATTSKLNLLQRINILIDVASALDYLHNHCLPTIVHCDLKPSNILLDDDMVAHVGDFGLARFLGTNSNQNNTSGIRGTIGYAPPEYGVGSEMTSSGDVYSFGILLLELMTGKRPTDNIFHESLNIHKFGYMALPDHVTDVIDVDLLSFLQEDVIATQRELANAKKIEVCLASTVKIGVSCSLDSPPQRMDITYVVNELYHILVILKSI
ncbi:hypothetical protein LXL04_012319 [Taraxacum kok-saghyz]